MRPQGVGFWAAPFLGGPKNVFMGGQSGEVGAAPFCLAKQNKTTTPPRDGGVSEPPTMPEKVGEDPAPPPRQVQFVLFYSVNQTIAQVWPTPPKTGG